MAAFLNDRSLEAYNNWAGALTFFLFAAQELLPAGFSLLKDSRFFGDHSFSRQFNHLGLPRDQHALILQVVFGNRYYKCWTEDRASNEAERYTCADPSLDLVDESLSEAAERQFRQGADRVSILSASDSAFHNKKSINLTKNSTQQSVELRNAVSLDAVREWLAAERGFYDPASRSAPHDFQTVLVKQANRFRATGKFDRKFKRKIFEEIASGNQYYVDDAHPGHSAHLEVFSATGEHLGIADVNTGTLDVTDRVEGRKLKL
jgi:hypothetical protein